MLYMITFKSYLDLYPTSEDLSRLASDLGVYLLASYQGRRRRSGGVGSVPNPARFKTGGRQPRNFGFPVLSSNIYQQFCCLCVCTKSSFSENQKKNEF